MLIQRHDDDGDGHVQHGDVQRGHGYIAGNVSGHRGDGDDPCRHFHGNGIGYGHRRSLLRHGECDHHDCLLPRRDGDGDGYGYRGHVHLDRGHGCSNGYGYGHRGDDDDPRRHIHGNVVGYGHRLLRHGECECSVQGHLHGFLRHVDGQGLVDPQKKLGYRFFCPILQASILHPDLQ